MGYDNGGFSIFRSNTSSSREPCVSLWTYSASWGYEDSEVLCEERKVARYKRLLPRYCRYTHRVAVLWLPARAVWCLEAVCCFLTKCLGFVETSCPRCILSSQHMATVDDVQCNSRSAPPTCVEIRWRLMTMHANDLFSGIARERK